MQQRVVELISRVSNEEVTEELLHVNDDLNNIFLRYERYGQSNHHTNHTNSPFKGGVIVQNDNVLVQLLNLMFMDPLCEISMFNGSLIITQTRFGSQIMFFISFHFFISFVFF